MSRKRKASKSTKSARKSKSTPERSAKAAMSVATSGRKDIKERVSALAEVPLAVCEDDGNLQATLDLLRNRDEPLKVRLAALQALQAASFSVISFQSCRADYIAALREVATDPNEELRQRVLGILAREQDGFVQKKLLEGLQNPEKALVPPEKALQLLSYDIHADAYSLARKIIANPPNTDAKREALRLLAADATAAPVFEKILRDKNESPEIRQVSAAALQALKPEKLQAYARMALLDPDEHDQMQATSLTALAQFGDHEAIAKDKELMAQVTKLSAGAATSVKQGARQFLKKFGG